MFAIWLDKRFKPFSDKSIMIDQTLYRLNGNPCYNFIGQTPRRFEKRQRRFKKRRLWTVFVSFFKCFLWQKKSALPLYKHYATYLSCPPPVSINPSSNKSTDFKSFVFLVAEILWNLLWRYKIEFTVTLFRFFSRKRHTSTVAYVIPWFFFVNQGCYIPKCSSWRVGFVNGCCDFFFFKSLKVKVKGQRSTQ